MYINKCSYYQYQETKFFSPSKVPCSLAAPGLFSDCMFPFAVMQKWSHVVCLLGLPVIALACQLVCLFVLGIVCHVGSAYKVWAHRHGATTVRTDKHWSTYILISLGQTPENGITRIRSYMLHFTRYWLIIS